MFQIEVFIFKLIAIDGFATSAIVVSEVATLTHEVRDDTVKNASFISISLLTSAQRTKILSRFWNNIST